MPRVSQDYLDAQRTEILEGARRCFAELGYEEATVVRLEATADFVTPLTAAARCRAASVRRSTSA